MSTERQAQQALRAENAELRRQLEDAEETLRALRGGEVDAVIVGEHLYMLESADIDSNRFRGDVLAQINDAVVAVDNEQRITYINAAAERQYGVAASEVLGSSLDAMYAYRWPRPEDEAAANAAIEETGIWRGENVHVKRDGEAIHVESHVSRLRDRNGEIAGLLAVIRDISERKRVEQSREELLEREQAARAQAEEASRLKDEFLATVSHELRTPLNAILGWARMLNMHDLKGDVAQRGLTTIEKNAQAQAQLIEDLLDVSRIVSGKLRLSVMPVRVAAIIEDAVETIHPAAEAKGVSLDLDIDSDSGLVSADPQRLQQMVWNLLSNAVKFTPRDGHVQVRLARVNSHVEIVVSDTGQGIAPEFLPYVFDRFRQADGSITRPYSGLGLGLAIVRHLVELHGGSVEARSAGINQGAMFTIRLPLLMVHMKEGEAQSARRGADGAEPLRVEPLPSLDGVRVLVVDDEVDALLLMSEMLSQCGASVKTAASGEEAFAELKEWHPHVIVSDIGMPKEDGYAFMKRVRSWTREIGSWIPAVALTAFARAEDRMRALASGYQIHVPKPVEPAELITVIASLVERPAAPWKNQP
ncbi:MAG TPA: ATP-binding protein [Blastocatellia bacterium]|nr:ATP-binding protein [Blastocatellia bacterium]